MKITDIRCYVVEDEHPAYPFRWRKGLAGSGDGTPLSERPKSAILRMDTDEGIIGATRIADGEAVASLTRRRLKGFIGEDPLMTERLWTLMWEIDRIEEVKMAHLGLIDLLAWDIKAKKASLPLYQLLGGNDTKVRAYASTVTWDTMDEYERHIKECIDVGFTAFKLHAWGDVKEDARLSRNLRKWCGDDAELMFDGSAGWDLVTSLEFGRVMEECNFFWYEEPMREFNLGAYAQLGIRMAQDEINKSGGVLGRELDIISEDSVNPATGATKAQRMLDQDKVAFLMGEINSAVALTIMQVAERNKRFYLQIGARSDALRGKNCNRYTFHVDIPSTVMVNAVGLALCATT